MDTNDPVFDLSAALDRLPDHADDDLLREMAQLLLDESERRVDEMHNGIQQSDHLGVQRAAHTLKSAADLFDSRSVVSTAREIEMLAKSNELEEAKGVLVRLESHVAKLRDALRSYLEQ